MKSLLKNIALAIGLSTLLLFSVNLDAATHPVFSKVIVFGDSLSDIGNNQDYHSDRAPETNKMPEGNGYRDGDLWISYFIQYLSSHGYLLNNDYSNILKPSYLFDRHVEINPAESLDFAYSGDTSGGLDRIGPNNYSFKYHMPEVANVDCFAKNSLPNPPSTMNEICGVRARAFSMINNPNTASYVDPNALYVIWIGANDIQHALLDELSKEITNSKLDPDKLNQLASKAIASTIINISNTIEMLKADGAKYFVVLNLPNLGFTPMGYYLNSTYNQKNPNDKDVVLKAFDDLTAGFNSNLKTTLNNISNATVYQPDFDPLFEMIHKAEIPAFPSYVNSDPVGPWQTVCCSNHENTQGFDPATCTPNPNINGSTLICTKTPKLATGGYFTFYNAIHPSTCANSYIARYVGRTILGKVTTVDDVASWDPNDKTTMPGCALL